MAVLSVLAATFAVMALGAVLVRRGISPFFALGVFALPAVPTTVYDMMPELLQLGLLTVGLLAVGASSAPAHAAGRSPPSAWPRSPRVVIAGSAHAHRVRAASHPHAIGAAARFGSLTIPFLVYASWITFVYAPRGCVAVPFAFGRPHGRAVRRSGRARSHSRPTARSVALWFAVGVCMLGRRVGPGRRDAWLGTVIAFAVMAVFMGSTVWQRPDYFGRVLLPLYAYGVLIVASALWERRAFVSLHRARSPVRSRVS